MVHFPFILSNLTRPRLLSSFETSFSHFFTSNFVSHSYSRIERYERAGRIRVQNVYALRKNSCLKFGQVENRNKYIKECKPVQFISEKSQLLITEQFPYRVFQCLIALFHETPYSTCDDLLFSFIISLNRDKCVLSGYFINGT